MTCVWRNWLWGSKLTAVLSFLRLKALHRRKLPRPSVHHGGHQELPVRLVWKKEADTKLRHQSCRQQEQAEVYVWGESADWRTFFCVLSFLSHLNSLLFRSESIPTTTSGWETPPTRRTLRPMLPGTLSTTWSESGRWAQQRFLLTGSELRTHPAVPSITRYSFRHLL